VAAVPAKALLVWIARHDVAVSAREAPVQASSGN